MGKQTCPSLLPPATTATATHTPATAATAAHMAATPDTLATTAGTRLRPHLPTATDTHMLVVHTRDTLVLATLVHTPAMAMATHMAAMVATLAMVASMVLAMAAMVDMVAAMLGMATHTVVHTVVHTPAMVMATHTTRRLPLPVRNSATRTGRKGECVNL